MVNKCQEVYSVETVRSYSNLFQKKSCCCWRVLGEDSWRNQVRWFRWWWWQLQTFHLHYRNHMHQVHVQGWDLWCFFISQCGNPKDFNFRTVVFLAEWFGFFYLSTILLMVTFFSFCSTLCLLCWPPWLEFYTKHQLEEHQ